MPHLIPSKTASTRVEPKAQHWSRRPQRDGVCNSPLYANSISPRTESLKTETEEKVREREDKEERIKETTCLVSKQERGIWYQRQRRTKISLYLRKTRKVQSKPQRHQRGANEKNKINLFCEICSHTASLPAYFSPKSLLKARATTTQYAAEEDKPCILKKTHRRLALV